MFVQSHTSIDFAACATNYENNDLAYLYSFSHNIMLGQGQCQPFGVVASFTEEIAFTVTEFLRSVHVYD